MHVIGKGGGGEGACLDATGNMDSQLFLAVLQTKGHEFDTPTIPQ